MKPDFYIPDSKCAQVFCGNSGIRASYIERGSIWESRVRFYHREGGFYELSARAVRSYLGLMFRGGKPRKRLMRLYRHARRADCLVTRYA